jgi:hypothetical protein
LHSKGLEGCWGNEITRVRTFKKKEKDFGNLNERL